MLVLFKNGRSIAAIKCHEMLGVTAVYLCRYANRLFFTLALIRGPGRLKLMSILEMEVKKVCAGCGNSEAGLFAEFNQKLLCSQCFKQEIESRVKLTS